MTAQKGTGIAGAADYHPATHAAEPVCWICGGPFKTSGYSARVMPGELAQACSAECAADPRYAADPRDTEIARLRAAFLAYVQADNACAETGAPCREPAQCGCAVEMDSAVTMAAPDPR